MRIETFRQKIKESLGERLEHATPENVRQFVDSIQQELWREHHPKPTPDHPHPHRIDIRAANPMSYEGVIQSYFAEALAATDRDQALIQLWILALDLAYFGIEEMNAEGMERLFRVE